MINGSWVPRRSVRIPRLLPRRLRSLHSAGLALALVGCLGLGWLWFRGSSFVRVQRVTVTGLSGPDVARIRAALTATALQMTTLDMNISRLEAAVSRYPFVRALTVSGNGAHAVVIRVTEQIPVALIQVAGGMRVVDSQGELLPATTTHGSLPQVPLGNPPSGSWLTAPGPRGVIAVLAAAPYAFLAHITTAVSSVAHGVTVQLRNGPQLYFGQTTQLARKWNAAVAVLRSSYTRGAAYIDLSDPRRPAPGVPVVSTNTTSVPTSPGSGTASVGGGNGSTSTTAGARTGG